MANKLNDKELKTLQSNVEKVNALNKQVLDYSFAQFKACQLKDEAENTLRKYYEKLSKKYNNGNPIELNIETGEYSVEEEKQG